MRQILGKFGTVTVIAQLHDTPTVFVTFNHLFALTDGDRFWGDSLFDKLGISAIGVMTDIANWYPPEDMVPAIAAIRAAIGGRRVVTYGNSQGGYGALKFSAALGADAAVALDPQYTIDPATVLGADPRYGINYVPGISGGDPIEAHELCANSYVIYDRFCASDEWHAARLAAVAPIIKVISPFTPHSTVSLLADSGLAPDFIALFCVTRLPHVREIRAILRAGRRYSRLYYLFRLLYLLDKQPQFRNELIHVAPVLEAAPRRVAIGVYLAELGLAAEAAELLEKAETGWMGETGLAAFHSICRRTGQNGAEVLVSRAILSRPCWEMFYRIMALDSLIKFGLLDEARPEFDRMLEIWGPFAHPGHIRNIAQALGRDDILARLEDTAG